MSTHDDNRSETSDASLDARVMMDARYMRPESSGMGRYSEQVVRECLELDPAIRFRLLTHPDRPQPIEHRRVECEVFSADPHSLRTQFLLPLTANFDGVDLYHGPANVLPAAGIPVPRVLTLHDVMWLKSAGLWTDEWWRKIVTGSYWKAVIPNSVRRADRVVTVSETVRDEIERMFPDMRRRVDVTYNGVDPFFHPIAEEKGRPRIDELVPDGAPFVLVVGRGSPYKNHPGAAEAFARAFGGDSNVRLVLVRNKIRSRARRLEELKQTPGIGDRIHEHRYVDGEQLRALYSCAAAFLFPSFYEGFGLPALEAMACGTPVVTSNVGAPDEVTGGAALKADPHRPGEIAEALQRAVRDEHVRETLRERGRRRAEQFTWRRCAAATLDSYRNVLTDATTARRN